MPDDYASAVEKKLVDRTADTTFQLVWGQLGKLSHWVHEKATVMSAMRRYAETYRQRYGEVKVLGMSEPIALHEIYTAVKLVPPEYLNSFKATEEMEETFRGNRRHYQGPSKDGIEIANAKRFLNILGPPGSGKSTFLRRLGQEAMLGPSGKEDGTSLSTKYQHTRVPVILELRRFRDGNFDLLERLAHEFHVCGFPNSQSFVESLLAKGQLLIILDGLDEVPDSHLEKVVRAVSDFIDRFGTEEDGNRFVTSCRTAHYKNYFAKFSDVVLADFSYEQIAKFSSCWFSAPEAKQARVAEDFMQQLGKSGNAGALELARTPLLLTFLCLTYQNGQELPPTRARLYQRSLDILLREWATERFVHKDPVAEGLHADLELEMLAGMAADLFKEDRFFFTRNEATEAIDHFMQNELNAPKPVYADAILTAIEVQQGLIVKRAQDAYSFSHLTIQEYLTAREFHSTGEWLPLVDDHLLNDRWLVVFELMSGMAKSDRLLVAMSDRCKRFVDGEWKPVLRWIESHLIQNEVPILSAIGRLCLFGVFVMRHYESRLGDSGQMRSDDLNFVASQLKSGQDVDHSRIRQYGRDMTIDLAWGLARGLAEDHAETLTRDFAHEVERYDEIEHFRSNLRQLARAHQRVRPHWGGREPNDFNDDEGREHAAAIIQVLIELRLIKNPLQFKECLDSSDESLWERLDIPVNNELFFTPPVRHLGGFDRIRRCRKASYSLSAAGWGKVCDAILRLAD